MSINLCLKTIFPLKLVQCYPTWLRVYNVAFRLPYSAFGLLNSLRHFSNLIQVLNVPLPAARENIQRSFETSEFIVSKRSGSFVEF